MCVYIYAVERKIEIRYASETITLDKRDSGLITVDLLIKNKSEKAISSIQVMYPRPFFPKRPARESYQDSTGHFSDITASDFRDSESSNNRLYNVLPCTFSVGEDEKTGKSTLTIEEPDPASPPESISYSGAIAGTHEIVFDKSINETQWRILTELGFALFTCELTADIQPEESRWFRWQIIPARIALTKRNRVAWLRDWFLNRLTSHYQILGPEKVQYQLHIALLSYIEECNRGNLERKGVLVGEAQDILIKVINEQKESEVHINDWRIHIFPGVFRDFDRVNYDGDVLVCGTLPNESVDSLNRPMAEFCYQWKAGRKYIPSGKQIDNGLFSISFSATRVNRILLCLPWISMAIAICGLILSLKHCS